jgi:hypothetical protein
MRRDVAPPQSWTSLGRRLSVLLDQICHTVSRQWPSDRVPEKNIITAYGDDSTQGRGRFWPQRTDPLFAPLAEKTNLAGPVQMESGGAERKRFGHAGSSVVEEQQQRTIPITMPRARIDCSDQCTCLLRLQVRDSSPRGPFGLYGKDGAVLPSAGDIVSEKTLYEAPHRCQTAVTSDCGVATLRFDMFQKRQDRVGSNIVECQTCNRFVLMARKEQEE